MRERYSVRRCGKEAPFLDRRYERVRTLYIMAEEVEWEYSQDRHWEMERHNSTSDER